MPLHTAPDSTAPYSVVQRGSAAAGGSVRAGITLPTFDSGDANLQFFFFLPNSAPLVWSSLDELGAQAHVTELPAGTSALGLGALGRWSTRVIRLSPIVIKFISRIFGGLKAKRQCNLQQTTAIFSKNYATG